MRKTVLILGVSSFVGSNLAEQMKSKYRVVGTYFHNKVKIPGVLTLPCDVLNRDMVQTVLYTFKPDVTIYAVGLSSIVNCDKSKKIADALNTSGVFNVTTFSERYKSKFCYFSSAYIFGGEQIKYREDDAPVPNTFYGGSKASAEFYIQKFCLNYLILRVCDLYGRSYNPLQMTTFEMIEHKCVSNQSFTCDSKIHTGLLDVIYLADVFEYCIDNDIRNRLFQISTQDIMSRYDFAKLYTEVFKYNANLVLKGAWAFPISDVSQSDYGNLEGNYYFHLDTDNFSKAVEVQLPSIKESLLRTYERFGGKSGSTGSGKTQSTDVVYI